MDSNGPLGHRNVSKITRLTSGPQPLTLEILLGTQNKQMKGECTFNSVTSIVATAKNPNQEVGSRTKPFLVDISQLTPLGYKRGAVIFI